MGTRLTSSQRGIVFFNYKEGLTITECWLNSIDDCSKKINSEILLEASINRVPAKLAVRDKFEKLLYLSSSSTFVWVWSSRCIKCSAWNVLSVLICRVTYPLFQRSTCTWPWHPLPLLREKCLIVLLFSDTVGKRVFWWRSQVDVEAFWPLA